MFNIIFEKSGSNFLAVIVLDKIWGFLLYSSKIELYQVELIFVGGIQDWFKSIVSSISQGL